MGIKTGKDSINIIVLFCVLYGCENIPQSSNLTFIPSEGPSVRPSQLPRISASDEPPIAFDSPILASKTPGPPIPSYSLSPTPTPSTSSTGGWYPLIEPTTFNGKVFDDSGSPLNNVTVRVRSLNPEMPFKGETQAVGGVYTFNNAPPGVQIEIIASKAGFTTRRRVEVLKSNKQGDPNANRYDFGNDGSTSLFSADYQSLSDLPEVIRVSPGRNAAGVDPKTNFIVTFSEPMDKKTVEATFTIRAYNKRRFTVDNANSRTDTNTVTHPDSTIATFNGGTKIWDKDAFNVSWNSDDTEVTFAFKEEKLLPSDKDSNLVADYQVAFNSFDSSDRVIKDKSGISRSKEHFKLTEGNFEESYKFSIQTDEAKPELSSIIAQTDENQGEKGDSIWVNYSERMIIYTRDKSIAGGMEVANTGSDTRAAAAFPGAAGADTATAANTADNYDIRIIKTGGATKFAGKWSSIGGTAVYDTNDVTHKTVILLAPTVTGYTVATQPTNTDAFTFTINYTDGTHTNSLFTSVSFSGGRTYAQLQTDLNGTTHAAGAFSAGAFSAGAFTVTESTDTAAGLDGNIEVGDTFTINLAGGATFTPTSGSETAISFVKVTADGAGTLAADLGVLNKVFIAGSNNVVGQKADFYEPGDTVRVTVDSTVLDPAGNTMNTSRDDASANAS